MSLHLKGEISSGTRAMAAAEG